MASSANGTRLVAIADGDRIYTSEPTAVEITSPTFVAADVISGQQYDTIELQYLGNNLFHPLSHEGPLIVR